MSTLGRAKDIAEILSYITIVVGLPLAILQFRRTARKEQADREYGTYNALDEKYLDFLRLCFDHPRLDIFDIAGGSPELSADERKQELVAFTMLFSILERAFLMYSDQTSVIKARQWSGWHDYVTEYCRRSNFRSAWRVAGDMFDTEFYNYIEGLIANTATGAPIVSSKDWRIRLFLGSRDTDFPAGLKLYSDLKPEWLYYSSNTIAYWVDHYAETFGDRLIIAGLFRKNKLVGVAQLQYLRSRSILIINFSVIAKESRRGGAFRKFVDSLADLLGSESVTPERTILEIGIAKPWNREGQLLYRLLRALGFRTLDWPYYFLHVGQPRIEVRRATLFIKDNCPPLNVHEFLDLASLLCSCHVRWNLPFTDARKLEASAASLMEILRREADSMRA
jgi:hypothetical protein